MTEQIQVNRGLGRLDVVVVVGQVKLGSISSSPLFKVLQYLRTMRRLRLIVLVGPGGIRGLSDSDRSGAMRLLQRS